MNIPLFHLMFSVALLIDHFHLARVEIPISLKDIHPLNPNLLPKSHYLMG